MPKYVPEYPSEDSTEVLYRELLRISQAIEGLSLGHLDVTYVAPSKPRAGDFRYADGTQWDPGSGEGLYRYSLGGSWTFIG